MLVADEAIRKDFVDAVEEGILASMKDERITRIHITTRLFCASSGRRLQQSSSIQSESIIDAVRAEVPVLEVREALQTATIGGQVKNAVETRVQAIERIADVTVGLTLAVGTVFEPVLVDPVTTTVTMTTTRPASSNCGYDICVGDVEAIVVTTDQPSGVMRDSSFIIGALASVGMLAALYGVWWRRGAWTRRDRAANALNRRRDEPERRENLVEV